MTRMENLLATLSSKGLTLGSAESLTGGLFGASVCAIPGASAVYKGGVISYSPEVKEKILRVSPDAIADYGVVSAEVAKQMAVGGKDALQVDVCVSCTGNAGPTAEPGKAPVGRVYLGVCYSGSVWTIPLDFTGDRNTIRKKTVDAMVCFVASLFPNVES
ncbi:MAG: CinA family protein [Candidatus Enteromonas sp.]|nr:CinA family protein [Candidatus Enteromonas sp.]